MMENERMTQSGQALVPPEGLEPIENYYGVDLGDGESAVAWMNASGTPMPLVLEIAGRKSVLTALGEGQSGTLIGEEACLADANKLYLRFKSRYLREPDVASPLITAFATRMREEIVRGGKAVDPATCAAFVGCPSGWGKAARDRYRQCFVDAGFPNVTVISESRAAFMFVRESGELRLSDHALSRPTLVIDAGSSTTDFTFIRELRTVEVFDFGENHLGGGLIDQLLLQKSVRLHPQKQKIERIFAACPQYEARCELEARKVKEMFFTRQKQLGQAGFSLPCESSVKIYYEKPPITLDISLTPEDMAALLQEKVPSLGHLGYLAVYKKALASARTALKETLPVLILLTGGASRMDFMESMARDAFPEATLVTGAEPEFSIARGLCYALRTDLRTERFARDIKVLVDSDAVESIVDEQLPRLFSAIAPVIAAALIERVAPSAFSRWRHGAIDTLDEMSEEMKRLLEMEISQGLLKSDLEPVTRAWLETIRPALEVLTDPICARCALPLTTLRLPTSAPVDAAQLNVDAAGMVNLDLIQAVVDVIVASVVAILLGGSGVALMMAGPLGLILSFLVGFIASRLGTSIAIKHVGKFKMPAFMRTLFSERAFARSLEAKHDELAGNTLAQLTQLRDGKAPEVAQMSLRLTQAIERQLTDMAEQARLLIH
ncbi:MAG: hypothetical protein RSG50_07920 [Clostridia bacterium]